MIRALFAVARVSAFFKSAADSFPLITSMALPLTISNFAFFSLFDYMNMYWLVFVHVEEESILNMFYCVF